MSEIPASFRSLVKYSTRYLLHDMVFGFSEVHSVKELPAAMMNHVISSALWKPVFMRGLSRPARSREPERCSDDTQQVQALEQTARFIKHHFIFFTFNLWSITENE